MKRLASLLVLALFASCAPPPPPHAAPFHAVGTEPFWNLLIDEHDVTFTQPGAQPIRQATPQVIHGFAGEIYRTPRISVNIVHARCNDGLSDRLYPNKVQVTVDGHRFDGCGGL